MDTIQESDVLALLAEVDGPVVSVYAPMQPPNLDIRQNPLQFRNLLNQAETQWSALGQERKEIKSLLQPAVDLLADEAFWRLQGRGLAVFLSKNGLHRWRLSIPVRPHVHIERIFHVRPLLRCIDSGELFLLAVSQKQVRFWQANGRELREIALPSVANGMEALGFEPRDGGFQSHSSQPALRGKEGGTFHGQGGAVDVRKDEILAYFREIDRAIAPHLQDQRAPLYFAGVGYLFPIYREANNYRHLVQEPLEGNPELLSAEELRDRARRHLQSQRSSLQSALHRYEQQANSGRRSNNLSEIALAASHGRVDTLFVTEEAHQWGRLDAAGTKVEQVESQDAASVDLYELAVVNTLRNRGKVFVLNQEEMPDKDLIAASFRYPMPAEESV